MGNGRKGVKMSKKKKKNREGKGVEGVKEGCE